MDIMIWVVFGLVLIFGLSVAYLRVPPVPTRRYEMDLAFRLADIRPHEIVFDLGAGDGRMVAEAVQLGATASGWELNPVVWLVAKIRYGASSKIWLADMWGAPVETADVVFAFLMPPLMPRVERELWSKMKKGSRLVSNAFPLPNIVPTREEDGVYLYIR